MKVAVLIFDGISNGMMCGVTNSGRRICNTLRHLGVDADSILVTTTNKSEVNFDEKYCTFEKYSTKFDAIETLKPYDFIYLASTDIINNMKVAQDILTELDKPFGFVVQDEVIFENKYTEWVQFLINSSNLKFVQVIQNDLLEGMLSEVDCPCISVPTQLDPTDQFISTDILTSKTNDIFYCGRMASRKKVAYLLRMEEYLNRTIELHGTIVPGIHNVKLREYDFDEFYKGDYDYKDNPSKRAWYQWSVVTIGKGRNLEYCPRIERSPVESLLNYSLPIFLTESIPEEFCKHYPLHVDWLGEDGIGMVRNSYKDKAEILEEVLEPIDKLSIHDKVDLIKTTYDRLFVDTDYFNKYNEIIDLIRRS